MFRNPAGANVVKFTFKLQVPVRHKLEVYKFGIQIVGLTENKDTINIVRGCWRLNLMTAARA